MNRLLFCCAMLTVTPTYADVWLVVPGRRAGITEHEYTHSINNSLRAGRPGFNAVWDADDGKAAWIPEPPITLRQVASATTTRGPLFNLYVIRQQTYWNRQPLYLLDELSAYTNGIDWYRSRRDNLNARGSYNNACEMLGYCDVLLVLAEKSGYDSHTLRAVLDRYRERLNRVRLSL